MLDNKIYSDEEIEKQYFLRGLRPDYDTTVIPDWIERSDNYKKISKPILDIKYGSLKRNFLDFFPVEKNNGFILYIHGGYWQRGDKSIYSFIAEEYNKLGFSVAIINYQMCPEVKFADIKPQIQQSISWLWDNSEKYKINKKNFNIIGHSAGAHLTVEMLLTNWTEINPTMPAEFINCSVAVSGIYDLIPLLHCSENNGLKLNKIEAQNQSPIYNNIIPQSRLIIAYGLNEPEDMHRQSISLYKKYSKYNNLIKLIPIKNCDHFDTVNTISSNNCELFKEIKYAI